MDKDMTLLRDLWRRINPDCAIGAEDATSLNIKMRNELAEEARIRTAKITAAAQVERAKANGTLRKLPLGLQLFCLKYDIISDAEFSQIRFHH